MYSEQAKEELKANVKNTNVWIRLLFMVLFTVLYSAAEVVLGVVILYQFLTLLVTGQKNEKVLSFGSQLASYIYQVFQFLTFNTERKPFPMGDWPSDAPLEKGSEAVADTATAEQEVGDTHQVGGDQVDITDDNQPTNKG